MSALRFFRRLSRRDRGAVAVEFALVVPVLLFMTLLLVDFGRMAYVQLGLNAAAHEGVRASFLQKTTSEITSTTVAAAPGLGKFAQINTATDVTVSIVVCNVPTVLYTQVTASTTFKWITPLNLISKVAPGSTLGSTVTLSAKGVMRCIV